MREVTPTHTAPEATWRHPGRPPGRPWWVGVLLWVMLAVPGGTTSAEAPTGTALIPAGSYAPFYPPAQGVDQIRVAAFRLDKAPVTNGDFLRFVGASPRWRRGQVPELFADVSYLSHWGSPTSLGTVDPLTPVTRVSWFAARAYCASRGMRLPTEAEWEWAAAADGVRADARSDPAFQAQILEWYTRPGTAPLPRVGQRPANLYGIHDLHGLVWEWVEDFGATLVSGDAREGGAAADRARFCGAGSLSSKDSADYASFMRFAFRTSLKAPYTTGNLGFRCAASL